LHTVHNLTYYQDLMAGLRQATADNALDEFIADFHARQAQMPSAMA
ncbi:MAG: tRNA guanosine(34) transglycosylase Tgt, partial [Gammaproteobacteria bacterium]|nr:tRNA guanosine(34) transglycosylase Tgt [Gammaproteobacteria bacterium]